MFKLSSLGKVKERELDKINKIDSSYLTSSKELIINNAAKMRLIMVIPLEMQFNHCYLDSDPRKGALTLYRILANSKLIPLKLVMTW